MLHSDSAHSDSTRNAAGDCGFRGAGPLITDQPHRRPLRLDPARRAHLRLPARDPGEGGGGFRRRTAPRLPACVVFFRLGENRKNSKYAGFRA